jgi:hypothetical protein
MESPEYTPHSPAISRDDEDSIVSRAAAKPPHRKKERLPRARGETGEHEWTDFEMQAVLALLCKGVHLRPGGALTFATALNEALNGPTGSRNSMDDDVDVGDVEDLLAWIYTDKKGAL